MKTTAGTLLMNTILPAGEGLVRFGGAEYLDYAQEGALVRIEILGGGAQPRCEDAPFLCEFQDHALSPVTLVVNRPAGRLALSQEELMCLGELFGRKPVVHPAEPAADSASASPSGAAVSFPVASLRPTLSLSS